MRREMKGSGEEGKARNVKGRKRWELEEIEEREERKIRRDRERERR